MVSKAQPVIPPPQPLPIHLETIYEESGSSLSSSNIDVHYQSRNHQISSAYSTNQKIHGLISARSIPSVDVQRRQRATASEQKPPIEVRYRDGTKHYIHPALTITTTAPMINNRRKYTYSSRHDSLLSSIKMNTKHPPILNTTAKKKKKVPKKSDVVLTIITAEDLSRAGVTPSAISSPDESDRPTLIKSPSNSALNIVKTVKDISLKDTNEVAIQKLPMATIPPSMHPPQPVIDISISNLRFPSAPRHQSQHQPQLRHPQQLATIRSQSLPPLQSHFLPPNQQKSVSNQIPPVAVVPPSLKKTLPSLQITLTSDGNEKNLSSKGKLPRTTKPSSKSFNETTNSEHKHPFRPSATVVVGGGSRSAFRPFLRPTTFNPQPRVPSNSHVRSQLSTNQFIQKSSQQQTYPSSHSHLQQFPPTSLPSTTHYTSKPSTTTNPIVYTRRAISSDAPRQSVNPVLSNQILSDKVMTSTSKMNTLNYSQQSAPIFPSNLLDPKTHKDTKSHIIPVDPNLQWHSVTSKSLYDVPRLSNQYSDIPLRITIPDGTPTHNQKLLYKHDIALEKRLLDAGLSPETIALYERILEVADVHQMDITSPPEIIDQYQQNLLL